MLDLTDKAFNGSSPHRSVPPQEPSTVTGPWDNGRSHGPQRQPRLVLAQGLVPLIGAYLDQFFQSEGEGLETGGMLVGEFARLEGQPSFKLTAFIDAGPKAEHSAVSVLFDHDYQAGRLEMIRRQYPQVGNMGCLHVHPDQMDQCSVGDWLADVEAVQHSDTHALVFGLVTLNNPAVNPWSLVHGRFKLDFFVMAEQAGFEYLPAKPVLADLPVVETATVLPNRAARVNQAVQFGCHGGRYGGLLEDKRRLVAEVRAMEERYGDRAVLHYEKGQLFWEYTVVESGRRFPIEVRYPARYPLEPPRIVSRLPLPPSPHQLVGYELCWIDRSVQNDWNPARDTAATCISAAHRWFACLLVYITLGDWPEEANDGPVRPR